MCECRNSLVDGAFFVPSLTFSKRYKRSDGKGDSSAFFGKNDSPELQIVCRKAYEYLNEKKSGQKSESEAAGS